jgi:hypothetical protein
VTQRNRTARNSASAASPTSRARGLEHHRRSGIAVDDLVEQIADQLVALAQDRAARDFGSRYYQSGEGAARAAVLAGR